MSDTFRLSADARGATVRLEGQRPAGLPRLGNVTTRAMLRYAVAAARLPEGDLRLRQVRTVLGALSALGKGSPANQLGVERSLHAVSLGRSGERGAHLARVREELNQANERSRGITVALSNAHRRVDVNLDVR